MNHIYHAECGADTRKDDTVNLTSQAMDVTCQKCLASPRFILSQQVGSQWYTHVNTLKRNAK